MAEQGARHFLPWVRQGIAAGIGQADSLAADQPAEVSVPVTLEFGDFNVTSPIRLYGPAQVASIDPGQIVRTEPRPGTTNHPYNLFPSIEFDRPDMPWLFTPARAGLNERLRPWLCLVVVKQQDGVVLTRNGGGALPVLEIGPRVRPALELPDPDETWAWAHAQVTGAVGDSPAVLKDAIARAPARTVSRLLCPRRLEPATAYHACVVPSFDVGRKSGLGLPVTDGDLRRLEPAWSRDASIVSLPVYYAWEFRTGENADFETLARLLEPRPLDARVGTLPLDIGDAGYGVPRLSDAVLPMRGVLQPPALAATEPPPAPSKLQAELAKLLNAPADRMSRAGSDPVVAPPIYGASYASRNRVEPRPASPPWLDELNLDPRHRIAAALGARIVQQDQEALMASAWEQAEALRQANLQRRRGEVSLVTRAATYTRQISRLDPDALLQILGPSLTKVSADSSGTQTMAAVVWASENPAFCAATLRRAARPRGPVNRRFLSVDFMATRNRRLVQLVDSLPPASLRAGVAPAAARRPGATRMVTIRGVSASTEGTLVDVQRLTPANVLAQQAGGFFIWNVDHWERSSAEFGQQLRQAAFDHLNRVMRPGSFTSLRGVVRPDTTSLLAQLDPESSRTRVIALGATAPSADDALLASPAFPRPMSERLIELAPELLLPGLQLVPPNTVTLVPPNDRFIEAFMVGLNHEMGGELLWREYPSDRRGTYFRHFWDGGGDHADGPTSGLPPIHTWTRALGENTGEGHGQPLVLLVRGELFRRYPSATLYAVRAERDPAGRVKPGRSERYPLFRGAAPPDVAFFGFELSETEARGSGQPTGDPGWFFVIQQQPGEPDFGLDVGADAEPTPVTQWNQLTWRHLVRSQEELTGLTHVRIEPGSPPRPDTSADPPGASWGLNAAHMARITLQQPVRIAIHASQMLPPATGGGGRA